jgi:DNA polymerase/3'-5' exonuclease PolX
MHWQVAHSIAHQMLLTLQPFCEQIDIAGSIRRGKPECHDIEILALPKFIEYQVDLFGATEREYPILEFIKHEAGNGSWQIIKGGNKYIQLALPYHINLDMFLVTPPAQYGLEFLIRTGPREFNVWLMTPRSSGGAKPSNARISDGCAWVNDSPLPMPTEVEALNFFGLEWLNPEDRQPRWPSPISTRPMPINGGCYTK